MNDPAAPQERPRNLRVQSTVSKPEPSVFLRFKPVRAARVSEISETTRAAPVPNDERVNFHIGNPLQDSRLSSAFLRIALGIDIYLEGLSDNEPDAILDYLGWETADKPKLDFLIRTIQKSSPYMPRGGYSRRDPHTLIKAFREWLEQQQEPLHYDIGEQSGKREIILASGGIQETLRMFLFAISSHLEVLPARIVCYRCALQPALRIFPNLYYEDLAADERIACQQIEQLLINGPNIPTFLLIGDLIAEETRRKLRLLSIEHPIFLFEVNNAPNHLSLAREAKLIQRVIRLLTPAVFDPRLQSLSTVFVAGNADFLSVVENVHFNLKGTPSASEVEFLTYLLDGQLANYKAISPAQISRVRPSPDNLAFSIEAETALPQLSERVEQPLERILDDHARTLAHHLSNLEGRAVTLTGRIQKSWKNQILDEFASIDAKDLIDLLVQNVDQPVWGQALQNSFLSAFIKHQPQYLPEACLAVSGSSRTALGILGFHCGISEVVIPDLSWSYEQCFPIVHAVKLTPALGLDVQAVIDKVEELCRQDPSWRERGAVVINNPHNATGQIFNQEAIRALITYCMQQNLYFIDDLAYQNLAPLDDLPEIKTARQLVTEQVRLGILDEEQANRLISVHSMSKTDCLAGARLAVVEIRDQQLRRRFNEINSRIQPNLAAIFVCYLFYRTETQDPRAYSRLRNKIFYERKQALLAAVNNLPPDRNPYNLEIIPPTGSMYPLLKIGRLPAGLSLDWLASSLARLGIGLLPLVTFARTEQGYEMGRTSFRLTLGGVDRAEVLQAKTRRLLIYLNRLITEEEARYNRKSLPVKYPVSRNNRLVELSQSWDAISKKILQRCEQSRLSLRLMELPQLDGKRLQNEYIQNYAPERLNAFRTRLLDRALVSDELVWKALNDDHNWLGERLEREFMKDSLQRRQELFRFRTYDRTVHPTQVYSLQAELVLDAIVRRMISDLPITSGLIDKAAQELIQEYIGSNVSIDSKHEADEIIVDLDALITGEEYAELFTDTTLTTFLSFWSDWDGSNRPSGQGHRLIATVVMENVSRMANILRMLRQADPNVSINPEILYQLNQLPQQNQRLIRLFDDITLLTHQLEQRYHGVLPFSVETTPMRRLATRWHLRPDPAKVLWKHNDRYERKMLDLRRERRTMLESYFAFNKQLRKQLFALIPAILSNCNSDLLLREVVGYRDILQRTVITPRIHQGMITARDQFAIDTTVFNIIEINSIAGKYGNPGATLAIQISLSSKPEALVSLDRKMRIQAEQIHREYPSVEIPPIRSIPLFEDIDSVKNIRSYLDRVWDYAIQSRSTAQMPQERFSEIISEVFIAGSDLSQQVSQATGAFLYVKAKYDLYTWLAEHGVAEAVRIKLGSGEPMQRQGGYYSQIAGLPAFLNSEENKRRFSKHLPAATRKSTFYAVTPLHGIFLGGDMRTFQSNLSEQLRNLPVRDLVNLLYHVRESQRNHRNDLIRAVEMIAKSRLGAQRWGIQELERVTFGSSEALYEEFLNELMDNFRQILFGRPEDVIGIHIISYYIGKSIPQLRDRPTSRKSSGPSSDRGQQVLANIAEMIPLSRQGSLLRAIAHNQAQTVVLGINQLTTGLFRALERFAQKAFPEAERERMIAERLLPRLPIYEILNTLRIYQDWNGEFVKNIETAFPAGNSAFVALREDSDAMQRYIPLFQKELLRRHGINVNDFFPNAVFISDLLPTLRPDLAVLLQKNLANTNIDILLEGVTGRIPVEWRDEVARLLLLPDQIRSWRSIIWEVIGVSIYQRVKSFAELATALYEFSSIRSFGAAPAIARETKLSSSLAGFFRTARTDNEMRNFLISTIEYLNSFTEGSIEVPVSIIRAMNDVERIAQFEESSISPVQQKAVRCCVLQIARLAGENG